MSASSTSNPRTLGSRAVHLWYTFPEQATHHDLLRGYQNMLSLQERQRYQRFVFEKDRLLYLVAHGLLRTTLSRYADVASDEWKFTNNDHGKPEISFPVEFRSLRFNLSHTNGLVACAITRDRDVGVDVESVERPASFEDLARRNFAAREFADLQRLPNDQRPIRFYDYWTLKEAYIKARGLGLSIPLDGFWFDLIDDGGAAIHFAPTQHENPTAWQFRRFQPGTRHKLAIAIHRPAEADLDIIATETVPAIGPT